MIAAAHRYFVSLARSDPDLRRGIAAGRLQVANERVALFAAGGALLAVMRAVLDGHAPKDADIHHAEGILRMLGRTPDEAVKLARRPLRKFPGN